jgi:hypothetical protein
VLLLLLLLASWWLEIDGGDSTGGHCPARRLVCLLARSPPTGCLPLFLFLKERKPKSSNQNVYLVLL